MSSFSFYQQLLKGRKRKNGFSFFSLSSFILKEKEIFTDKTKVVWQKHKYILFSRAGFIEEKKKNEKLCH
jgi:hypothetical protein